MTNVVSQLPTTDIVRKDDSGAVVTNPGWVPFFNSIYTICSALTQSGTTANRPTKTLWTGRMYFDTTLGKPIWYKTAGWVDATGGAV